MPRDESPDRYAHIADITASLREDLSDARERLSSLETHVRVAHVKEMESMGERIDLLRDEQGGRIDRLRDNVKGIRRNQWLVISALVANLAYNVFKPFFKL